MRIFGSILIVSFTAAHVVAQAPEARPGQQLDLQTLGRTVRAKQSSTQLTAAAKAAVEKLLADSASLQAAGRTGEARRLLANALTLLGARKWDQKEEFVWSLALRPDKVVADSLLPLTIRLTQAYPAAYETKTGLTLRVSLEEAKSSNPAKDLGSFSVSSRDLIDQPFAMEMNLDGVADGSYRLAADLLEGDTTLVRMSEDLQLVQSIESQRSAVERRLAKIQGHDSAKATVRWPYDMARVVNLGIRKWNSGDFGLREDRTQTFDFVKEIRDSQQTLKVLESGSDPLLRAKGDHERHYWFKEAGEIMPYRLYVPTKWDGRSKLRMIFVLHGNSRDHDFYFDRDNGILPKLAEQYGFLVVCPMGYRPSAGYNATALRSLSGVQADAAPRNPGRGGFGGFDPARQRQSEWSETDAMNVLDLVQREYPIDPARIYLFGHSAGGTGGWYLAAKYPEKFAGIALSAFNTRPETYPFDKVKGKPVMVIIGTKDTPNTVATVRLMAKILDEKGLSPYFLEVEGATHDNIVGIAEPKVFEFFDKHSRK